MAIHKNASLKAKKAKSRRALQPEEEWNEEEYQAIVNDVIGLPAKSVRPYCLWFNFLQAAIRDPETKVNQRYYREWEPYENIDFLKWWPSHSHLFKVDIGVRLCEKPKDLVLQSTGELILRVPLYQSKKQSLKEIGQLLDDYGASDRLRDMKQGKFQLSVGVAPDGRAVHPATRFLRNLQKISFYSYLYIFWLLNHGLRECERLEQTVTTYRRAIKEVRTLDLPSDWYFELPHSVDEYADYLKVRGSKKRLTGHEANEFDLANNRRQALRYIRKAQRIVKNVAQGIFPGEYEKD